MRRLSIRYVTATLVALAMVAWQPRVMQAQPAQDSARVETLLNGPNWKLGPFEAGPIE